MLSFTDLVCMRLEVSAVVSPKLRLTRSGQFQLWNRVVYSACFYSLPRVTGTENDREGRRQRQTINYSTIPVLKYFGIKFFKTTEIWLRKCLIQVKCENQMNF